MNEKEFAKHILELIKSDDIMSEWYQEFMYNKPLSDTETTIVTAYHDNKLNLRQIIRLSIFIGLTTKID